MSIEWIGAAASVLATLTLWFIYTIKGLKETQKEVAEEATKQVTADVSKMQETIDSLVTNLEATTDSLQTAKKTIGTMREELDSAKSQLKTSEKTVENLNEAYDKSQKEIEQIKKWYEGSIAERKKLEGERDRLSNRVEELQTKFHERNTEAIVMEERLLNIYARVDVLEKESSNWREIAETVQRERDLATGKHLGVIEFTENIGTERFADHVVDLLAEKITKLLAEKIKAQVIESEAVGTGEALTGAVTSATPDSKSGTEG